MHCHHRQELRVLVFMPSVNSNAAKHGEACVVIGGLSVMSSANMLMTVRKQSLNAAFSSVHIFIYCSADLGDFRFGIKRLQRLGRAPD